MQPQEKLDVYRVAGEFCSLVDRYLAERPGWRSDERQLDRAAGSISFNIAEGAGEFAAAEKARIYRLALRSATECSAIIARLHRRQRLDDATYKEARELLNRIVLMLTRLVRRFSTPDAAKTRRQPVAREPR